MARKLLHCNILGLDSIDTLYIVVSTLDETPLLPGMPESWAEIRAKQCAELLGKCLWRPGSPPEALAWWDHYFKCPGCRECGESVSLDAQVIE